MEPVSLLVAGAGSRGAGYAEYALAVPENAKVVAVAEPDPVRRGALGERHGISADRRFEDWRQAASHERLADAVIIATQDPLHTDPAIAFAQLGYHILLEKPMAPTPGNCRRIVAAALDNDIIFAVCHVLRYTEYTRRLKAIIDAGTIGEVVSLQRLEPVGYWHQAHSFVRGNWANEGNSSCMLLAKSCHDLDWIRYIIGASCKEISSFGNLRHFRRENQPAGAGERCLECAAEPNCPYSAKKIYLGRIAAGQTGWPVNVLTPDTTDAGVRKALAEGPYGRCVYMCDNDVVDHQVVNMLFENGATASFTMTAFTQARGRETSIFGTRGELLGDGRVIKHFDFLTDEMTEIDTATGDASILGGHGGGDFGLMASFVKAVATQDPSQILSGPEETLETHLMVFAAEQARRQARTIPVA